MTECQNGTDPSNPSDDCTAAIAEGIDICALLALDPTNALATADCDNGGADNATECTNGGNPSDDSDDCSSAVAAGLDICSIIAANPSSAIATADCDGGGVDNLTECFGPNGGRVDPVTGLLVPDVGYAPQDPNDPSDDYDCESIVAAGVDICTYISQFPTSNIATADCDGGGVDNLTECFGPGGGVIDPVTGLLMPDPGYTPLDPNDPADDYDCTTIIAAGIDICDYIAQFPTSNIAIADCDGGGVDNLTECFGPNGGRVDPVTGLLIPDLGYTPRDPNNPNDDFDCEGIAAAGIDICAYIAAFPMSNIATLDCDGGGVDNATECANGGDPLDASDECTSVMSGAVDICAILAANPNHPLATLDCDGGGIDNLTECNFGGDPTMPADDCTIAANANVDVCALIAANPNHPLAQADCDGGGVSNIIECANGGDPLNGNDDCSSAISAGLDICAMIAADPNSALAVADCDGGGIDNATECANGTDPSDSDDDCQGETPTIDVGGPYCEGEDIVLSTSTPGTMFEWIGPLGASQQTLMMPGLTTTTGTTTIPSSSATYLAGDWSVRVTDAFGCSYTSEVAPIEIFESAISLPRNNGPICEDGGDIQLIGNEVAGAVYNWYIGDPNAGGILFSTDMSPTLFSPEVSSTEYYLVIELNGCASPAVATTVEVTAKPESSPIAVFNLRPDCSLEDLLLESNAVGAGPFEYLWTGPNNFISTEMNPSIMNITEDGNGSYTLVLTDANGCESTSTVEINNISNPQAQPVIATQGISCDEGSIVLSTQAYFGTNVTYTWTTPNGDVTNISGLNTNEITISPVDVDIHDGDYIVTVVVDNCTVTSAPFNLEILDEPLAAQPGAVSTGVCVGENIQLQSPVASAYLWSGPNAFTSELQFPVIENPTLGAAGTYFLTVFNEQGCRSEAGSIEITVDIRPEAPTLIVAEQSLCDGEMIQLSTSSVCDEYRWIGPGGSSSVTLSNPLLNTTVGSTSIPSDDEAYSAGVWSVICVNGNGCESENSNSLEVSIVEPQTPNPVASQSIVCETEPVELLAGSGYDPGTIFTWYDANPNLGAANVISNQMDTGLSDQLIAGEYTFYLQITQNGCNSEAVPVTVTIEELPDVPVATNEGPTCEGMDIVLSVLNPDPEVLYRWFRVIDNFQVGTGATLVLATSTLNDEGGYYVIGDEDNCSSEASNVTQVTIDQIPNIVADAGEDDVVCTSDYTLQGNFITQSEGFWSIINPNGATEILTPGEPITEVTDLAIGENIFVWSVGSGACSDVSSDTITVIYNNDPEATDDIYTIAINEQIDDSVLNNDTPNTPDFVVSNFTDPSNGTLVQNNDGTFSYVPNENFVGTDSYSYELCHIFCPENCVEATVFITVGEDVECFAPTIMTPNGDGVNDTFTIPCLSNFEGSHMCIFNRWGDEVFLSEDYRNDWDGTFKKDGNTLPSGTYFYILQVNDGNNTVMNGYIFIER